MIGMVVLDSGRRLDLAYDALDGLSVADALGAQFFVPGRSVSALVDGEAPAPPWEWTDDTEMACTIVSELRDRGGIDQDSLALLFADRCEPYRGYGPGAVVALHAIRDGVPWWTAATAGFGGGGSLGNGAAMRVAPLGAFFADDADRAARVSARSAVVTHAHPEGITGAVAIGVAAALVGAARLDGRRLGWDEFFSGVLARIGRGPTRDGVARASQMAGASVAEAAYELGNGTHSTAADSVPLALWVAATFLDDYRSAVVACVRAGGDVDTIAAMAGGVVATFNGARPSTGGVPEDWLAAREPLPTWANRSP